jgi:hypothetical protein
MTPQSKKHKNKQPKEDRDALIRHHCEEISTHLAALKQLHQPTPVNSYAGTLGSLTKMGEYLKGIYIRHGGTPH